MKYNFFAYMARMKLIRRWGLMKSFVTENIAEHSAQVAQLAHALALIKNKKFGGQLNADRIATMALYHETSEVLTGDLPTPIKYYNSEIKESYKAIERTANNTLIGMLPEEFRAYRGRSRVLRAYSDKGGGQDRGVYQVRRGDEKRQQGVRQGKAHTQKRGRRLPQVRGDRLVL